MSTNISLTPELESYAKGMVSRGLYKSISEFMREAVRLHREKNREREIYLDAMNKELNLAANEIDQNEISPLDMNQIKEQAFQQLEDENG